jgi:hypothetical protein
VPATLTEAMQEAVATAPQGGQIVDTLEIMHPTFVEGGQPAPVRVCTDVVDRTFTLEAGAPLNAGQAVLFKAVPFEITLPESSDRGAAKARLALDVVTGELFAALDAALVTTSPITVVYRAFVSDAPSEPGEVYYGFVLRNASTQGVRLEGELSFEEIEFQSFPRAVYDRTLYPSLP